MSMLRALVVGAMLAGSAGTAFAQDGRPTPPAPGRSGMSTSETLGNVNAYRDLARFGRCFANSNRGGVFGMLATAPGSTQERDAFQRLLRGEQRCLHGGTRTFGSLIYFRGVMAEGLLDENIALPANLRLAAPAATQVRDLGGAARCYASGNREQAATLLSTRLGSAEELSAIQSLWPAFNACIPRNVGVRLNAPWIRLLVAEAVLRLPAADAVPAGQ